MKTEETYWGFVEEGDIVQYDDREVVVLNIEQRDSTDKRPYPHVMFTFREEIRNPKATVGAAIKSQIDEVTILNA